MTQAVKVFLDGINYGRTDRMPSLFIKCKYCYIALSILVEFAETKYLKGSQIFITLHILLD